MTRASFIKLAALLLCAARSGPVHADEAELQWSARPLGGVATWHEETTSGLALAGVAGTSLGVSYGVSHKLDLGAEVLALATTKAAFEGSTIIYDGSLPLGEVGDRLQRQTVSTFLMLGPTWRYGVDWVPVVSVAAGGGMRLRTEGVFEMTRVRPMEKRVEKGFDLAVLGRVGIERRVTRRLTVGGYLSLLSTWAPSVPLFGSASLSFGVSYVHYPRFLR